MLRPIPTVPCAGVVTFDAGVESFEIGPHTRRELRGSLFRANFHDRVSIFGKVVGVLVGLVQKGEEAAAREVQRRQEARADLAFQRRRERGLDQTEAKAGAATIYIHRPC